MESLNYLLSYLQTIHTVYLVNKIQQHRHKAPLLPPPEITSAFISFYN
jgi:hypothetical protein